MQKEAVIELFNPPAVSGQSQPEIVVLCQLLGWPVPVFAKEGRFGHNGRVRNAIVLWQILSNSIPGEVSCVFRPIGQRFAFFSNG